MTVYVDDMYLSPIGQFRRMKMSHMIADTSEELLAMASLLGVKGKWIQHPGTWKEHFDIALVKRKLAVEHSAVSITFREYAKMVRHRQEYGCLPTVDQVKPKGRTDRLEEYVDKQIRMGF